MRVAGVLLIAAAVGAGEVAKGVFVDDFFNLRFAPPELAATLGAQTADQIFRGTSRGGIKVAIFVRESKEPRDAAAWLAARRAAWKDAKRKLENVDAGGGRIVFTETRLGVFDAHHGYAFYPRGCVCFEVHAFIEDRTATSDKDIRAALDALKLGRDEGCGVLALRIARQRNLAPGDPQVLLQAGAHYLKGDLLGNQNDVLAAAVLGRARRDLDALEKEQRWHVLRLGGEALLRTGRGKEAAAWFVDAAKVAPPGEARTAHYGRARALATAGDVDGAFAALAEACKDGLPVPRRALSQAKELAPLRKDGRWETFWMQHVERR